MGIWSFFGYSINKYFQIINFLRERYVILLNLYTEEFGNREGIDNGKSDDFVSCMGNVLLFSR